MCLKRLEFRHTSSPRRAELKERRQKTEKRKIKMLSVVSVCVYEFPLSGEGSGGAGGMKEDDRKLRRKATVCAVG